MGAFIDGEEHGTTSGHKCPMPFNLSTGSSDELAAGFTFQQLNLILSGTFAMLSIVGMFSLMTIHTTHYSRPSEQSKIMRICFVIPFYGAFSWLSIAFPNSYVSLLPWPEFIQAIALDSLFLLLCRLASSNEQDREGYFAALQIQQSNGITYHLHDLTRYQRRLICIFQYPVVALVVATITVITQAADVYCLGSSTVYFAHIWLEIIIGLSSIFACMAFLGFYCQLISGLKDQRSLSKVVALILLLIFGVITRILFTVFRSTLVFVPTSKLTYADIYVGIPSMLRCVVLIPFTILFWYAYSYKPYLLPKNQNQNQSESAMDLASTLLSGGNADVGHEKPAEELGYQHGFLGGRAWVQVMNPMDSLRALIFASSMMSKIEGDVFAEYPIVDMGSEYHPLPIAGQT